MMTDYKTDFGTIHYGGTCKDDYKNIRLYDQEGVGGAPVKLQGPAMRAFREAERRYAKLSYPIRYRRGKILSRAIPLTGSWRSCAYQASLYKKDPKRYASANGTGHTRGLAIDVRNDLPQKEKEKIKKALTSFEWKQARSDEPWHFSYWVTV
jgi:hypothetical protein